MERRTIKHLLSIQVLGGAMAIAATASIILSAGCGDGKSSKPVVRTYEEMIETGWEDFRAGDYNSALVEFKFALSLDVTRYEAFSGVGWSYAMIDSFYPSRYALLECLERNPVLVDPLIGLAAIYRDLPDFRMAVDYCRQALLADPDFEFQHQPRFDWKDIMLILAECYFALGQYDLAYAEIQALDPEVDLDPAAESFNSDLLQEIEALVSIYGGI